MFTFARPSARTTLRNLLAAGPVWACLLLMPTARAQAAAEPALPPGAIDETVGGVVWIDLTALTEESVWAADRAIDTAIAGPAAVAADVDNEADIGLDLSSTFEDVVSFRDVAAAAGAEVMVITMNQSRVEFGGVRVEVEVGAEGAAEGAAPGADSGVAVFLRLKEGVRPQQFTDALRKAPNDNNDDDEDAEDGGMTIAEAWINPRTMDVRPWAAGWVYVQTPGLGPPAAKPPAAGGAPAARGPADAVFARMLGASGGASVLFALRPGDEARQGLKQLAQDPNLAQAPEMAMYRPLLMAMQSLDEYCISLWVGENPRLRLEVGFQTEEQAKLFKGAADGLVTVITNAAQQAATREDEEDPEGAGDGDAAAAEGGEGKDAGRAKDGDEKPADPGQPAAPDPEAIRAAFQLLKMKQDGTRLSLTLDTGFLKQFAKLGLGPEALPLPFRAEAEIDTDEPETTDPSDPPPPGRGARPGPPPEDGAGEGL